MVRKSKVGAFMPQVPFALTTWPLVSTTNFARDVPEMVNGVLSTTPLVWGLLAVGCSNAWPPPDTVLSVVM
jgi:hypothetical protein